MKILKFPIESYTVIIFSNKITSVTNPSSKRKNNQFQEYLYQKLKKRLVE